MSKNERVKVNQNTQLLFQRAVLSHILLFDCDATTCAVNEDDLGDVQILVLNKLGP